MKCFPVTCKLLLLIENSVFCFYDPLFIIDTFVLLGVVGVLRP